MNEQNVEKIDELQTPAVSKPSFSLSSLSWLIGLAVIASLAGLVWQNHRLNLALKEASLKVTSNGYLPQLTATPTATPTQITPTPTKTNQVLGQTTTKGGLVLTPTPTKAKVKTVAKVIEPTVVLTKLYQDSQFSYKISYTENWVFRRTHGTNAAYNQDILSRVDLSKNSLDHPDAYVSAEVLSAHGLSSLEEWLKNYDSQNYAAGEKLTFAGQQAVKFSQTLTGGHQIQKLYFLKGAYAYRLSVWQKGNLSRETIAIRDSFQP